MAMRALSVLAAILFSTSASAQGVAQYPFCLQGADYPGWTNCNFTSYQQCQATASGTENECLANPWYNAAAGAAPDASAGAPGADAPIPIGPPPQN
jgi:Protein of unknown function (DUF3551)